MAQNKYRKQPSGTEAADTIKVAVTDGDEIFQGPAVTDVGSSGLPSGYLSGLITEVAGGTSISIGSGVAKDSTNLIDMSLGATITGKELTTVFAEGSGVGGRATGAAIALNTWYHVFLITKDDGTADVGFDTSITAFNLLADPVVIAAGYLYFRRIASIKTQAGLLLLEFYRQVGNEFFWTTPQVDLTGGNAIVATPTVLTVPLDVVCLANVRVAANDSLAGLARAYGLLDADAVVTTLNADIEVTANSRRAQVEKYIETDVFQTIRYRNDVVTMNTDLHTLGWYDPRADFSTGQLFPPAPLTPIQGVGQVGEMILWPAATAPNTDWLFCNGQSVVVSAYPLLFAVIGYTYGGSGPNFNVPDWRGYGFRGMDAGAGNDPDAATRTDRGDGVTGDQVGTVQQDQVGPHTHQVVGSASSSGSGGASGTFTGAVGLALSNATTETRMKNKYANIMIRARGVLAGSGQTVANVFIGAGFTPISVVVAASQTEIDIPIPEGPTQINITFDTLETDGSSLPLVQVEDDTGFLVAGYDTTTAAFGGASNTTTNFSNGFNLEDAWATTRLMEGTLTLTKHGDDTWVCSATLADSSGTRASQVAGSITLTGDLKTIRITMANGTDTFIGGSVGGNYDLPAQSTVVALSTEFCPGYVFNFISTNTFSILGLDASNTFYKGRRIKFIDGPSTYFGSISGSTYLTDTTIVMNMEGGDVLTNTISDFCLVAGGGGWSQIATLPFAPTDSPKRIATGIIAGVQWWVIVAENGQIATSSDQGTSWTLRSSGTVKDFLSVGYDSTNETFMCGGTDGEFAYTSDGVNFTLDTTSIPALTTGGTGDVHQVYWSVIEALWGFWFDDTATNYSIGTVTGDFTTTFAGPFYTIAKATAGVLFLGIRTLNDDVTVNSAPGTSRSLLTDGLTDTTGVNGGNPVSAAGAMNNHNGFYDDGVDYFHAVAYADFQTPSEIELFQNTSGQGEDNQTFPASPPMAAFAYSPFLQRWVTVGHDAQIGWLDQSSINDDEAWTFSNGGFSPIANIVDVARNDADGQFIAIADNGQICRSSTGLGDMVTPTPSWTLRTSPFAPVNAIEAGTIGGVNYLVAVGNGGLLSTSIDGGSTWVARTTGTGKSIVSIAYNASDEVFAMGMNAEIMTTDDFVTFNNATSAGLVGDMLQLEWWTNQSIWFGYENFGSGATWTWTNLATGLTERDTSGGLNEFIYYSDVGGAENDRMWGMDGTISLERYTSFATTNPSAYIGSLGFTAQAMSAWLSGAAFASVQVGASEIRSGFCAVRTNLNATLAARDDRSLSGIGIAVDSNPAQSNFCIVTDSGDLGILSRADWENGSSVIKVGTVFDGSAFTDVKYDPVRDEYIACNTTGEIGFSPNGFA